MKSKRFLLLLAALLTLFCLGLGGKKTNAGTLPPAAATVSQTRAETETTRAVQDPTTKPTQAPTTQPEMEKDTGRDYVANRNSYKFHYPYCSSVDQMLETNRWDYHGTREALIEKGYTPCKRCNP